MQYLYIFMSYLVLLNLFTSYRLLKDDYYNTIQKSIQLLIIWIVPLLGAMMVAYFSFEEKKELRGVYKRVSWLSRLVAAFFFIKLYSKREMLAIENSHDIAYYDSQHYGYNETNLVETGFGVSGGGDA